MDGFAGAQPRGWAIAVAILVVASACPSAVAAHADNDRGLPTFSKIELGLDGHISARCEMGSGREIDFGQLTGGETATADLGFECNVPFEIGFQSMRGGLAHVAMPNGQGPFAGLLGYSLEVRVPTRSPEPRTLHANFDSRDLTGRKTLSSNGAIAAGGARLEFRTEAPRGAGLLAGEYSETLSVTITPRF